MEEPLPPPPQPHIDNAKLNNGRLYPTKTLPANAIFYHRFVLANWKFNLMINLGGIVALFLFGWIFLGLAIATKPQFAVQVFIYLIDLPKFLITLAVVIVIHELCHFLFYWLFSKRLPKIGFKLLYAHADSSDFYFPRNQFVMTAVAPFVVLTAVGLLWLPHAHILLIPTLIIAMTVNAAGSVGDLILAAWLLSHPAHSYVLDEGTSVAIYRLK